MAPGDDAPAPDGGDHSLFVVHLPGGGEHDDALSALDAITLSPGLHLVRSGGTQSGLYHRIKRETGARALFVGRLHGTPKFMGMEPGSLRDLRSWDDLGGGEP